MIQTAPCLLGETSGEGTYYYFVIGRFSLIIVLILGVGVVQALLKACSSRSGGAMRRTVRRVDQLEMVESVVLTFGLTTCWRGIFGNLCHRHKRLASTEWRYRQQVHAPHSGYGHLKGLAVECFKACVSR